MKYFQVVFVLLIIGMAYAIPATPIEDAPEHPDSAAAATKDAARHGKFFGWGGYGGWGGWGGGWGGYGGWPYWGGYGGWGGYYGR